MPLVAESPSIDIMLKPTAHSFNPMFEFDQAPKELAGLTVDGKPLSVAPTCGMVRRSR
jgi:hypothetical protein